MKITPPTKNSNPLSQLLRDVRTFSQLNLAGWKRRAGWLLDQYLISGNARHLTALTRHVNGIKHRFGVM